MANYTGTARTNYVTLTDLAGAMAYLAPFTIEVVERDGKHALLDAHGDGGGWPTHEIDDDGNDIEFDFVEFMQFVSAGEVLVFMEAGAEKQRYVFGCASAYVKHPDGSVGVHSITLDDIYGQAVEEFGDSVTCEITRARY